ncbi:MAG TPA: glycosyltransferase, partial [Solirubrobacteraceae bacterium]|nr:glycosyltransferase [Solirubrobacteraceae bacterium]
AQAREQAAMSSNVAHAARMFGDRFPVARRQWPTRAAGLALIALMLFYLPWMVTHLPPHRQWLTWPFAAASLLSATCLTMSVINGWSSRITPPRPLRGNDVATVAVLIPTFGEPIPMVLRTVLSVLAQDYPAERRIVVVSDDGHNPELAKALDGLGVHYHEPPDRWAPPRNGAPKSGNLNSALEMVTQRYPHVAYIETRDADDEVGSLGFLRQTVGQLEADPGLAFVQTVKEAQVAAGDPFGNFDGQFYRSQMLARNATNSVFPCGSGLVWRRSALESMGGFPTWNLVEDFQSGVEALRRGWRGCYLTIVGAVGQHSPEDIPNVNKQRGTWAIDTVRLMVWGQTRGLTLRQRLAFLETLFFYAHSFTVLVYVPVTALAFLGILPLTGSPLSVLEHLMPYALAAELRFLLLNRPFGDRRRRQRHPLRALWRVKVMWIGLAPVYIVGCLKALFGGPGRKPIYKVTRKTTLNGWYWKETVPQAVLAAIVPLAAVFGLAFGLLPSVLILISAGYWGIVQSAALGSFVARGWFGASPMEHLRSIERRRSPAGDPLTAP